MDVHASPASLPELDDCLSTFKVRFRLSEAQAALERYLTGLLTQLPNKIFGGRRRKAVDFDAILEQILALVQSQRRVSYRAIKRRFDVADDELEDLKEEILFAHPHIVDEEGRGLVWTDFEAQMMRSPQFDTGKEPSSSAVKRPVTAPLPDAERRQLTVMFCDLVDSTRLAGQLDPEDLREVVRAYQQRAARVIQQYEDHIAQYLGDGLLIYFGWPRAHEDDAHRAVHTGLSLVEAMDDLNTMLEPAYGVQLAVRLGIHIGPVVVGEIGGGDRHENLALGETPNIAARLEGLAEPNTVIMSNATRRLVAGAFDYDELGTPALKGVNNPLAIFRVRALVGCTRPCRCWRFTAHPVWITFVVESSVNYGATRRQNYTTIVPASVCHCGSYAYRYSRSIVP